MKYADALKIANDLVDLVGPCCERIEIAGSIRRQKAEVKDIEILAVPKFQSDLFGSTLLDHALDAFNWASVGKLEKNGHKYKKIALKDGINLDLFIVTPPAMWGVQLVIRTGPADFSRWMVTWKQSGGALPNSCYVKDGAVWDDADKSKYNTPEEIDFFRLCGLEWIEPGQREARWTK